MPAPPADLEFTPSGLLPRLAAGSAALSRGGRRTSQTALFLLDATAHIKSQLSPLPDARETSLRRQSYAAWLAGRACELNGFEVRVRGQPPRAPAILVCNHVGWQDPILIFKVVPALAIAKHEVGRWPLVGEIARGLDFLLVDRQSPHSGARVLLRAKTLLERGASILTFPEGTTSHGDEVLPFRRGMFGLARHAGVPIVPIALRYLDAGAAWVGDDAFLPHFLRTVARPRTVASLEFGAPIHALLDERPEALAERARAAVRALLRDPQ
ncbi:MAG: lysophospholipid acyltransferase family protein [Enhygromyxa sp.]